MKTFEDEIKNFMLQPDMVALKAKIIELRKTKNIYPIASNVYNAFKLCPYDKVRVVLIGSEPYHIKDTSNGLSYSSLSKETPPSLLNIFKEIQRSLYPNDKIEELFKTNDLSCWAKQGVLLLNTCLTVEEGKPNSHKGFGWEKLVKHVIQLLDNHENSICFVLWGDNAKEWEKHILNKKHYIIRSVHPSPLSASKGFIGNNHFVMINDFLESNSKYLLKFGQYIDFKKIREEVKSSMKKNGYTKEQWEEKDKECEQGERWARLNYGVWIDNKERDKSIQNIIDWRIH